jgi:uncharacterized protein (UPF0333 family)
VNSGEMGSASISGKLGSPTSHRSFADRINFGEKYIITQIKGTGMKYLLFSLLLMAVLLSAGCSSRQPSVYNAPVSTSTASETLVLSKDLTRSDVPRDFSQDWGRMTYNLAGGGTYHIIVRTTGTDDAVLVQIGYQDKWNVDKFGNINYNPVNKYVGRADKFSDLDLKTTFPQDSLEQTIILVVQGQNGIISLKVYKVV